MTTHHPRQMPWLRPGHTAVVTGAASGIGFAAAMRFAREGLKVVLVDVDQAALAAAHDELSAGGATVASQVCDVADLSQVHAVRELAYRRFGAVHVLMNNAGVARRMASPWTDLAHARHTMSVNLWGVVHGCHAFLPAMLEAGEPGIVIHTGSKQGITRPPGNVGYNLSKAGVLVYTEAVAHELRARGSLVTAHLLVPGFVYTGMISRPTKPPAAWTPAETVDFMMRRLHLGDFAILCPDHETPRWLDERRIQWAADDLILNRPALSRWHPDYADAFRAFVTPPADEEAGSVAAPR